MRVRSQLISLVLVSAALCSAACGDPIELVYPPYDSSSSAGGGSSVGGGSGTGGDIILTTSSSGIGGEGGTITNVCVGVECELGQQCEDLKGVGTCVNSTCEDLKCVLPEVCKLTVTGGAYCDDIGCMADVDCSPQQYCDTAQGICADDLCSQGTTTCVGQNLLECAPNGSSETVKYTCGSPTYFMGTCTEPVMGDAYCSCEDDWDCPENTVCEVGKCTGTGKAPTCTLEPADFQDVLPTNEIMWGGTGTANKNAVNAPFPPSSQSSMTPAVANLDDDNGDGLINELDFPELIFMTYCGQNITNNGIVRAIHGGGPNKGKDYFAACGSTIWHEGDDINMACACSAAIGNSTGALAVGDLDYDGKPEIVFPTENDGLQILDNTGVPIVTIPDGQWPGGYTNTAVAIANIDGKGFAEIVVGNKVFTLDRVNDTLAFVDRFSGSDALTAGFQDEGPISCIGNITGDSRQEIIGGTTVYALPEPPAGVTKRSECPAGATDNFCTGALSVVWDAQTVNGIAKIPNAQRDGFCAIADILGANEDTAPGPTNPLDGKPEVILINNGYLIVLNGNTGTLRRFVNLNAGDYGGAPNVDDFDGDGFPEVGTALSANYQMIDLQDASAACPAWTIALDSENPGPQGNQVRNPGGACTTDSECNAGAVCSKGTGSCVCLHNGWARTTEDDSSKVTSSSVFDFNGDGTAEVTYNDECYFRIYDGVTAGVLFKRDNPSRTRIENPVVADVDNDGNAEIVFISNNEAALCSTSVDFPNGIQVWGDESDSWVSARRMWNQHSYHVTNVLESGGIPLKEPESWKPYNGRLYNTYRSNPRSFGIAPDLTVKGVQISSPDKACGELSKNVEITVQIDNIGDLRVGPGVVISFAGTWTNPALEEKLYANIMQTPLTATLQNSLEPGDSILVTVSYNALNNSPMALPSSVTVVVDDTGQERECNENNNKLTSPVEKGMPLPDLRVVLGAASDLLCPTPEVVTTVINDGSAPASNIVVRYYAGDPNQGGTALFDTIIPGPLAANGGSQMFAQKFANFPTDLSILIYAIVDPGNVIAECNNGNNKDAADNKVECVGPN